MPRFIYSDITDLVWANADRSAVNCTLHLIDHPVHGNEAHRFTAAKSDPGWPHSEEIFEMAEAGQLGPVAEYVAPLPRTPDSVTPSQAKIALFEAGLLDQVDALVAGYPYKPVQIWWANATRFEISNGYLQALGWEMGLSGDQIADLFIAAANK